MSVDLQIQTWFPTAIGVVDCPFHKDIKEEYKKHLDKFDYDPRGLSYTAIHKDRNFKKFNDWITQQVNKYCKAHNYPHQYKANASWVIDYTQGAGQPWHTHIGCAVSTVYYFQSDANDKGTQFRSPYHNDTANPLDLKPEILTNKIEFNELTFPSCTYPPLEGRLLIFRSYVEHMMDSKETKNKRIILSYNFDKNGN
jgi:uncharacterized protein (TIGR02466 family)